MIRILTSGFPNGFPGDFRSLLNAYIKTGMNLVFVASEFEHIHERTDWYCNHFLDMFSDSGIKFDSVDVIDSRMSMESAQNKVRDADVVWLSGGDTPTQFSYLKSFGLIPCIREHKGVVIGMSAGSINMTKTAICTTTCEHDELKIYEAIGLVEFSVEPHYNENNLTDELLELSETHPLYGICDNAAIICTEDSTLYIGDVFLIDKRGVTRL